MGDFSSLLKEIRQTHLCTYYLLPLTGLTRLSFGEGLFINSYLERKRLWIIVQVPDLYLVPGKILSHTVKSWQNDHGGFLAFQILSMWEEDIHKYIAGQYSRFSKDLKAVIFERSGLSYKEPARDGHTYTDVRLLALESREVVRRFIEDELQVTLDSTQEVLGIPIQESFMDVMEGE